MRIRLATESDGDEVAAIYRPAVVERSTSFELVPPDGAEMARRVADTQRHTPWLVAEAPDDPGRLFGYAYASLHHDRPAYRKIGYKFGEWHDVVWLSLALGAHDHGPPPPVALPEIRGEIEALLARGSAPAGIHAP